MAIYPSKVEPFPSCVNLTTYVQGMSDYEILCNVVKSVNEMRDLVSRNIISYAEPIQWDITKQYRENIVVFNDANKTAYVSVKPVPVGVDISDTSHWLPIFDVNPTLADAIESASYPIIVGSLSNMVDTSKIYILSTNMHIYYYEENSWKDSGYVYGTTPDSVHTYGDNVVITADNYSTILPRLETASPNTIYYISGTITSAMIPDMPFYGYNAVFLTLSGYSALALTGSVQIFAGDKDISFRVITRSGAGNWNTVPRSTQVEAAQQPKLNNTAVTSDNYLEVLPDAFNPAPNRAYYISASVDSTMTKNLPVYKKNTVLTNIAAYSSETKNGSINIFSDGKDLYFSICTSNAFGAWVKVAISENGSTPLSRLLSTKSNVQIKLIGDSITQGVGGSGFEQDGEKIPTSTGNFHVNTKGVCWANMLKSYIETNYTGCTVKNWGTRGVNSGFIYTNLSTLVEDSDDVVILMIGTNNRIKGYTRETCYQSLSALFSALIRTGKTVYVMSPPRTNDGVATTFSSEVLEQLENAAITNANVKNHISLYAKMTSFMDTSGKGYSDLLADNLHPNDYFYKVIYHWVSDMLGIGSSY